MGRGARRYKAPGPIANKAIEDEFYETKEEAHTLVAGVHYRCVNYNVWRFYELVHGGGPSISRIYDDIYSPKGQSILQAVIVVQKLIRQFLARCKRDRLYTLELSRTDAALEVIATVAQTYVKEKVFDSLNKQKEMRRNEILGEISRMTVAIWRSKKNFEPEGLLARRKEDQAVFARAPRSRGAVSADDAITIVQDLQPVIHLASTSRYSKRLLEADGIKFSLAKFPGTEYAVVSNSKNDLIVDGSRIVSINGTPTSALSFLETKQLLSAATWPIDIVFEKPPNSKLLVIYFLCYFNYLPKTYLNV
jgi:DNA-binding TFAR19-related protein (PDSD5 family)